MAPLELQHPLLSQLLVRPNSTLLRQLEALGSLLVVIDLDCLFVSQGFLHSFLPLELFHEHILHLFLLRLGVRVLFVKDKFPSSLVLTLL